MTDATWYAITAAIVIAIPFVVVAAALGTLYLHRIYLRTRTPRSWFFRAVVRMTAWKLVWSLQLAYIAIRGLGLLTGWFELWPKDAPPGVLTAWLGVCIIGLLSPPIYYALVIWSARRRASRHMLDPDAVSTEQIERLLP